MKNEKTEELYYAVLPKDKNKDKKTLYFWFSKFASGSFPSNYGWSELESNKCYTDKETILNYLHSTLALELDRGHWDLEEVNGIILKKVIRKTIITEDESDADFDVGVNEIKKIGKKRYGWKI